MRIEASSVVLNAAHESTRREEQRVQVRSWVTRPVQSRDALSWNGSAPALHANPEVTRPSAPQAPARSDTANPDDDVTDTDPKLAVLAALLRQLTGREVHLLRARDLRNDHPAQEAAASNQTAAATQTGAASQSAPARQGWGVEINAVHRVEEGETTVVTGRATVRTGDGRSLDVAVEVSMSRSFVQEQTLSVRAGDARLTDPLVVNLSGGTAAFGDDVARFDLDMDGTPDAVRLTASGSAYLARDLDGNGRVTDGGELFGPATGDGFAELRALDADGNGWIDENDPAFRDLSVAVGDGSGSTTLRSLTDAGVGAIGVQSVSSPFTWVEGGSAQWRVAETGLVLMENGQGRTIQHVDLDV